MAGSLQMLIFLVLRVNETPHRVFVVVDGVFVVEVAASAAQALWLHQQLTVFLFHQEDMSN